MDERFTKLGESRRRGKLEYNDTKVHVGGLPVGQGVIPSAVPGRVGDNRHYTQKPSLLGLTRVSMSVIAS